MYKIAIPKAYWTSENIADQGTGQIVMGALHTTVKQELPDGRMLEVTLERSTMKTKPFVVDAVILKGGPGSWAYDCDVDHSEIQLG